MYRRTHEKHCSILGKSTIQTQCRNSSFTDVWVSKVTLWMFYVGMINLRSAVPVPTCMLIWVQPPDKESTLKLVLSLRHTFTTVLILQGGKNVRQGKKLCSGNKMSIVYLQYREQWICFLYTVSQKAFDHKNKMFVEMARMPWERVLGW